MWRSLTAFARYAADLVRTVARGWNALWYTPADPILLGLIRIMTGLMLLYTHVVWGLALDDFFGQDAWISRDLAELIQKDQYAYSFWWSVPPQWIWPAYAGAMLVLALFTIGSKLQGPAWWNGQARWLAFGNLEYQSIDMTWLAWHPWLVDFLTHFTAAWELSFCVLIWIPILRPLVLAGAVVLHLGIGATLGLWTFSLIMLVGCMAFLPSEELGRLLGGTAPSDQGDADHGTPARGRPRAGKR